MTFDHRAGRKFTPLFLAFLAVGVAVSYSDSLGVGFYFDDIYGIANNPAIRSLGNIPRFFVDPHATWIDSTQTDLRPVLVISYALNYAVSGIQPWSYHVLNLVLHFIASVLVFFIVRDHLWWPPEDRGPSGEARFSAAAAALFFALAPLNSQPVVYVWARSALLCVTLYLGAFFSYLRRRWTLGSALFALALFTKAIAVTLPAVMLIYEFVYRYRERYPTLKRYAADWRRLILPIFLPALLSVAYLFYRSIFLPDWAARARQEAWVTPWIWFVSQWPALLYYVRLFLWPDALSIDHDLPYTTSLLEPRAWIALSVLLVWIGLALGAVKRHPQVTFATLWFFVTLAPESSFAPLAEVVNDHRPYIASSLGLSVLLAWALDRLAAAAREHRRHVFAAACLLLCLAAVPVNRYRTWQWGDPLRIWEDTVRKSPRNGRAWMNAGLIHMSRGDMASARRHFERARELAPAYAYVYMNLSVLEAHEGHLDKALLEAEEAVRLRPDLAHSHLYLGKVLQKLGRASEASAAYRRAIDLNPLDNEPKEALARLGQSSPESEEAMMAIGLHALYSLHKPIDAALQFRLVLERNPNHYGATFQLARALDEAGKPDEARVLWEKMLGLAQAASDTETITTVRARLARRP